MSDRPTRLRRHLTPSLVIALLALVVACSGTAVAAKLVTGRDIKNNSVTSADIKNNTLTSADIKNGRIAFGDLNAGARKKATADEKALWALVGPDGTFLEGNGVVATSRSTDGQYFVEFTRTTDTSPITTSLVNNGAGDGQVNFRQCGPDALLFQLDCITGSTDTHFVFVNTEGSDGSNADRPFMITVGPAARTFHVTSGRPAHRSAGGAEGSR